MQKIQQTTMNECCYQLTKVEYLSVFWIAVNDRLVLNLLDPVSKSQRTLCLVGVRVSWAYTHDYQRVAIATERVCTYKHALFENQNTVIVDIRFCPCDAVQL